jgi:hypothetical protein
VLSLLLLLLQQKKILEFPTKDKELRGLLKTAGCAPFAATAAATKQNF